MIKRKILSFKNAEREQGQSLVLIAAALIGLLAFVGLAVDVGFVFARNTQLQAAVDSAALAGVSELSGGDITTNITAADIQAKNFLNANDIPITTVIVTDSVIFESTTATTVLQETEYAITVTWPVDLFFLPILGFETINLQKSATAAFFPLADIYASRRVEDGALSSSNQAVFGPEICTDYGDPYSPFTSTFRPPGTPAGSYFYEYRILVPASYRAQHDILRVELFDPDSINSDDDAALVIHTKNAATATAENIPDTENLSCKNNIRKNACLIETGEEELLDDGYTLDHVNIFWFMRIDENRGTNTNGVCGAPSNYDEDHNTKTIYTLYYFAQTGGGSITRVDLASYTGQAGTEGTIHDTDMRWVSPGADVTGGNMSLDLTVDVPATPATHDSFEINICDCPDSNIPNIIEEAGSGDMYIYLEVSTIDGGSENGFEIWAGPDDYTQTVASDVNARNVQVVDEPGVHYSDGVTVFGVGNLPLNSNYPYRIDIPLIFVGPEYAGETVFVRLFDADVLVERPLVFFFDSIAAEDWAYTFGVNGGTDSDGVPASSRCFPICNNQWLNPKYSITVPGILDNCDYSNPNQNDCTPFYGGRLTASYKAGAGDTYVWEISLTGDPFLVK